MTVHLSPAQKAAATRRARAAGIGGRSVGSPTKAAAGAAAMEALYRKALAAGIAAGEAAAPTPMIVGSPSTALGSDVDLTKQHWLVSEGVCGFAWVNIPGTSALARWCKANDIGHHGHPSGWAIWVREHGQSLARKEAHARAMAKVLREAGIKAHAGSRMD